MTQYPPPCTIVSILIQMDTFDLLDLFVTDDGDTCILIGLVYAYDHLMIRAHDALSILQLQLGHRLYFFKASGPSSSSQLEQVYEMISSSIVQGIQEAVFDWSILFPPFHQDEPE